MKKKLKAIKEKVILIKKQSKSSKPSLTTKIIFALLLIYNLPLNAQYILENAFPNLSFTNPVDFQTPNDGTDRVFIVEQSGIIKVFENSVSVSTEKEFLNITERVEDGGEMGLLGLAFHPDHRNNGYFYVDYTKGNPRETVISRFKVSDNNSDSADINSELILMKIFQPYPNHNGGQIAFGPDSMLYIALGDGGSRGDPQNRAQNLDSLLGKILRINVDSASSPLNYSIPEDNPYANNTLGYREEIFAFGLRNPWRFSFDFTTGKIWCGDVGQGDWEEIDIIEKGKNYGWRCYEGNHEYNLTQCGDTGYVFPVWEYPHTEGRSITGGYVYRGSSIPDLFGKYIYADFETRKIWALTYDGINPAQNEFLLNAAGGISSFGVDRNKELYLCSFDGKIYKLRNNSTDVSSRSKTESEYYLVRNYPNPFNPSTSIIFGVPEESRVSVEVFDALGNKISELVNKTYQPGSYREIWNATSFSSGVYFIVMKAEALVSRRIFQSKSKALLLK
jgi:glucose/arabinose dehydrogenase